MKVYTRYPSNTIAQGLSRVGGLLAILNIMGLVALFGHQYLFERKLKKLDMQLLAEQQESLDKQRAEMDVIRLSLANDECQKGTSKIRGAI